MPSTPANQPNLPENDPAHPLAMIARREAYDVIKEHLTLCPFAALHIEERIRNVEMNYAKLIGFMTGSGILGGAAGATIVNYIH